MNLPRNSKIQASKIAVYWAVIAFGLGLFWTVFLNLFRVYGLGSAFTLIVPGGLAAVIAVYYYYARVHQIFEYDDFGYRLTRGRNQLQSHAWSEFKETSLIKDNYGRVKVRGYFQRGGSHEDLDSAACGLNPYTLRDFMLAKLDGGIPKAVDGSPMLAALFGDLEREIQRGRASWIADLNETFRYYDVSGEVFPLMARGSTRPKGFLLSRFVAVTLMPNYEVALYAQDVTGSEKASKTHVMRLVRLVETLRDERNIKWSWLLLFTRDEPPAGMAQTIQEFGNKDIGIGCIDVGTGKMIASHNQLGVSLGRQMRMNRLIQDLKRKRSRPWMVEQT